MDYRDILKVLNDTLPPVFRRNDLDKLTGGVITAKHVMTLPASSPKPAYARFGKFVVYEKAEFLKWAEEYYGNFTECNTAGFAGTKVRRNPCPEREAGSGGKGIEDCRGRGKGAAGVGDGHPEDTERTV